MEVFSDFDLGIYKTLKMTKTSTLKKTKTCSLWPWLRSPWMLPQAKPSLDNPIIIMMCWFFLAFFAFGTCTIALQAFGSCAWSWKFLGQLWFNNEIKKKPSKKHILMFWHLRRVYLLTTWGRPRSWSRPSLSAVWSVGTSYHAFQPGFHCCYSFSFFTLFCFCVFCFCCSCSCNFKARGHKNIYHECHFHLNENKEISIAVENFLEPEWISVWHLGKLLRQHPLKKRSYELVSSKVKILQACISHDSFQVFEYFLDIAKFPHQRGRGRRGGTQKQLFWLFREKLPRTSEFVGSPAIVGQHYFQASV